MSNPTKEGYHKGCFGSPTRHSRKEARAYVTAMRHRAMKYARGYVKRRRSGSSLYDKRMKDEDRHRRELDRIARKAMKRERGKELEKRTTRAQKV